MFEGSNSVVVPFKTSEKAPQIHQENFRSNYPIRDNRCQVLTKVRDADDPWLDRCLGAKHTGTNHRHGISRSSRRRPPGDSGCLYEVFIYLSAPPSRRLQVSSSHSDSQARVDSIFYFNCCIPHIATTPPPPFSPRFQRHSLQSLHICAEMPPLPGEERLLTM